MIVKNLNHRQYKYSPINNIDKHFIPHGLYASTSDSVKFSAQTKKNEDWNKMPFLRKLGHNFWKSDRTILTSGALVIGTVMAIAGGPPGMFIGAWAILLGLLAAIAPIRVTLKGKKWEDR